MSMKNRKKIQCINKQINLTITRMGPYILGKRVRGKRMKFTQLK